MNIINEYISKIDEICTESSSEYISKIMFRGHADKDWKIQSTLERSIPGDITCDRYYNKIDSLKPFINPIIGAKFQRKFTRSGYSEKFEDELGDFYPPEIEYMSYLRHHGFPTPIIDVSLSPYIALFFACENFSTSYADGRVFILRQKFVTSHDKSIGVTFGDLYKIGEYIETDKRHFIQQSQYLLPIKNDGEWKFTDFSFAHSFRSGNWDLASIDIPHVDKSKIMRELKQMNITRYTVYFDEDSLIKSFADDWLSGLKS